MQIDFINYPFTRILDRLLGPCFKTGPKGIPNLTDVDQTANVLSSIKTSDAVTSLIASLKSIRQSLQVHNMLTRQYTRPYKIMPFVPINFILAY